DRARLEEKALQDRDVVGERLPGSRARRDDDIRTRAGQLDGAGLMGIEPRDSLGIEALPERVGKRALELGGGGRARGETPQVDRLGRAKAPPIGPVDPLAIPRTPPA